jgi:SAF domain
MNKPAKDSSKSMKMVTPASSGGGRHMKLAGVGVAMAIAFGLIGGLLVARNGKTRPVVVASRFISAGSIISTADVRVERIASEVKVRSLSGDQLGTVIGQVTQLPIAEGSLMVPEQLSLAVQTPEGTVLVGATLEAGALPVPSLRFNDTVLVYGTLDAGDSAELLATATIWKIWSPTQSQSSNRAVITLAVPENDAGKVVGAAGANRIRLVLLPGKVVAPTDAGSPGDPTATTTPLAIPQTAPPTPAATTPEATTDSAPAQ